MDNNLSMRVALGEAILELGANDKVVALCADVKDSLQLTSFADKYPHRYFEFGVAEQNMVTAAAGMALEGLVPFACTYAAFLPGRCYDQIRISIAYNNANVKMIGSHAGISTGPDGATHQMLEDVAMMSALPNMIVLVPADTEETRSAILAAARVEGPVYIRLSRADTKSINIDREFSIGKAQILCRGEDIVIISNGLMTRKALLAASKLKHEGINATVINCHTVKPLDKATILKAVDKARGVVVAEEAQINGGLGSAVSVLLSSTHPKPIRFVAVQEKFGRSGEADELMRKYHLTVSKIIEEALTIFKGGKC